MRIGYPRLLAVGGIFVWSGRNVKYLSCLLLERTCVLPTTNLWVEHLLAPVEEPGECTRHQKFAEALTSKPTLGQALLSQLML